MQRKCRNLEITWYISDFIADGMKREKQCLLATSFSSVCIPDPILFEQFICGPGIKCFNLNNIFFGSKCCFILSFSEKVETGGVSSCGCAWVYLSFCGTVWVFNTCDLFFFDRFVITYHLHWPISLGRIANME